VYLDEIYHLASSQSSNETISLVAASSHPLGHAHLHCIRSYLALHPPIVQEWLREVRHNLACTGSERIQQTFTSITSHVRCLALRRDISACLRTGCQTSQCPRPTMRHFSMPDRGMSDLGVPNLSMPFQYARPCTSAPALSTERMRRHLVTKLDQRPGHGRPTHKFFSLLQERVCGSEEYPRVFQSDGEWRYASSRGLWVGEV